MVGVSKDVGAAEGVVRGGAKDDVKEAGRG